MWVVREPEAERERVFHCCLFSETVRCVYARSSVFTSSVCSTGIVRLILSRLLSVV